MIIDKLKILSVTWLIPSLTSLAMLLAFFMGQRFPGLEEILKPYAKYNLSILLLLNSLYINYSSLKKVLLVRPLLLAYGILVNNIFLPLVAFLFCYLLWPEALLAAILLCGISSGFSAVSFAVLLRLAPEFNLLLTIGSSFVVPFTLPFLLYILAGSRVEINVVGMMSQTALMVFVPVLLERLLFGGLPRVHACLKKYSRPLVTFNLSGTAFILMLSGQEVLRRHSSNFWQIFLFVVVSIIFIYLFSLLFFCRARLETQLIMLTGNLVSNTGLAAVLALDYLDGITLAITIVFGVLWNFNIVLLRAWPPLRQKLRQFF